MNRFLLALCLLIVIMGCDSRFFYEKNVPLKSGIWRTEDTIKFDVDIADTLHPYNLIVNIRNSGTYNYSNLFLFIRSEFPGGEVYNDTLECMLAAPDGKWLGSGIGDIYDNRILYKKNVRFPKQGEYHFIYEQGMRNDDLEGILDVGLRVEHAQ